ncbi:pantoate--beta-alanine ligase [Geminicoccus roseus]|uniref:pantoate--beta-alanine ligase n=1 Tax=Geminicoccus roseus TaxID=404900 RepID=UPI000419CAB6|nr:pantoate--beta-alanine ligase [Geminicoccus roseus]
MHIVRDLPVLRDLVREARAAGRRIGLVPTMGALHQGHLALVSAARAAADLVVTSIFVNPLQFGPGEDLDQYPRDEAGDLEKLRRGGCDLVWMPPVPVMYPPGGATRIEVGGPSEGFEGAIRPGHFRGVATVCTKLFLQTGADLAVFGEKDWQQLQVIRRMVLDLDLPIRIQGHATVREPDGLACSSRNQRLAPAERTLAAKLPRTMGEAVDVLQRGGAVDQVLGEARARLAAAGFGLDYLSLVEPATLQAWPPGAPGEARLLAAARLGKVRLLDNMAVRIPAG